MRCGAHGPDPSSVARQDGSGRATTKLAADYPCGPHTAEAKRGKGISRNPKKETFGYCRKLIVGWPSGARALTSKPPLYAKKRCTGLDLQSSLYGWIAVLDVLPEALGKSEKRALILGGFTTYMPLAIILSTLGYPASTVGIITGTLEVCPS